MEPDRWREVERLYHEALQCEESERSVFVERACSADQSLRTEVESLLRYAERPAKFFESPALDVVAQALAAELREQDEFTSSRMIDARIAQYRIVGKLGAGGMGDVYRAVRADDQYEKQVAIKLVREGQPTGSVHARFRQERQILAGFEHENIARLIDGGATKEGQPYFVMELVEGQPIDEYCDQRKLGTEARLDLFRMVCSAVHYAHQRLVVHRDIKPSNILVTADGEPKLLDFGIATILSPEIVVPGSDATVTGMRAMTPQFASPEQLRGGPVTTATDVYSLGVVLYKLLTCNFPYRVEGNSSYDLAHAIFEVEPEKPSANVDRAESQNTTPEKLKRTLSGDLDQILLKALRKEPQRRYTSAKDFAEDLLSYSLGLPVSARRGTFRYRSAKFIRRNKLSVAAVTILVLLILASLVVAVQEARIARAQSVRADRRFNDVRALANSLLFDIHDKIQNLPGSTQARKAIVDDALRYLDSLSQESADVPGLQRELAAAYERVGDVQGNAQFANLGDTAGSIASYRKALKIREALAKAKRSSAEDQAALAAIYLKLGFGLRVTNDFSGALENFQRAFPISERLANEKKNDPQAQEDLGAVCFAIAHCLNDLGNNTGAMEYYRKSGAIREAIKGGSPAFQAYVETRLAGVYGYMSGVASQQGDLDAAISLQSKSRDILAVQLKSDPQNVTLQQFLLQGEYWIGYYLAKKGLPAQALPHFQTALTGYQKMFASDAHDALVMRYLGKCNMSIGRALADEGKEAQGIPFVRTAVQIFETLVSADHADTYYKPVELASARSSLGEIYALLAAKPGMTVPSRIAKWREARAWYQKSSDTWRLLKLRAPLAGFDAAQPDKISAEIAKCDAILAALTAP